MNLSFYLVYRAERVKYVRLMDELLKKINGDFMREKKSAKESNNQNKRFQLAGLALSEQRVRNRDMNFPILVEGKRDKIALECLGFTGKIVVLNRGWTIDRVVTSLFEIYGQRNPSDSGPVISVLMDWDRTGGRLQKKLVQLMESFDMKVCQDTRNVLMKAIKPETRVVESLKGMSDKLLPIIDSYDYQN
tara:strand:+ start:7674 stop:8243 length:570 start_codon:yes stop_codon:yes gene_type:complete